MESTTIETVGTVAFNPEKTKVLLVEHLSSAKHLTGTYGIPAGRIKSESSLKENAARKFTEETGLTAPLNNFVELPFLYEADIVRKDNTTNHFSLRTFLCTAYSGELKNTDTVRPVWVNLTGLDTLVLLPNMKQVVLDAINYSLY